MTDMIPMGSGSSAASLVCWQLADGCCYAGKGGSNPAKHYKLIGGVGLSYIIPYSFEGETFTARPWRILPFTPSPSSPVFHSPITLRAMPSALSDSKFDVESSMLDVHLYQFIFSHSKFDVGRSLRGVGSTSRRRCWTFIFSSFTVPSMTTLI